MRKKGRRSRSALHCGLPEDALGCGARVTWFAQGSVLVEGQRGVVELGERRIRLRTDSGVLCVHGETMTIRELSSDAAMIEAQQIHTLTYLKTDALP